MKKILSLVLALAMILTAVCALAEAKPSKQDDKPSGSVWPTEEELKAIKAHNFGQNSGSTEAADTTEEAEPEIGIKFLDSIPDAAASAVDAIKAAVEKKDFTGAFGDVTVDGITNVNEIVAAQFEGDCAGVTKDKILNIKFATPYEAGTEVKVLIGIIGEDGVAWEQPFKGIVKDNTSIDVTVPAALFNKVLNNPFLVVVCN